MRTALLIGILAAITLSPAWAQEGRAAQFPPSNRTAERVLIAIDLLQPLGAETSHFNTAKSFAMGDMDALFTELARQQRRPERIEALFRRLDLSLDILGDEAGYTYPSICRRGGVRSLEQYRAVRKYVDRLHAQYGNMSSSDTSGINNKSATRQFYCAPRRYRSRSVD